MNALAQKPQSSESPSRSTELRELNEILAALEAKRERNKLARYRPYAKQQEFHAAGAVFPERMLRAANQVGKSLAGCAEDAMHLTGRYPDWWEGRRFDHPTIGMIGSESGKLTRDGVQRLLVGQPENEEEWGTGLIPGDCLVDWSRGQGVPNLLDSIVVKHVSGGFSTGLFKSYEQGRKNWQANTVHFVHLDEECPMEIYTEALTRTNATGGAVSVTFTPLMGGTALVNLFADPEAEGARRRTLITMTLEDAEHYTPERIAEIVASYPEHERDARTKGIPVLGSGLVFPVHEQDWLIDPIAEIPSHWFHLGSMDFGYDHPFAATHLTWDKDADLIVVHKDYSVRLKTPIFHAAAIKPWGLGSDGEQWLPWAWPPDGKRKDKDPQGREFAKLYKAEGLKMLPDHATFPDGGNSLEAGVMEILDRMQSGRFKVSKTCQAWRAEQRQYYRKDGVIVALGDDVISSSRYGVMMKRFAKQAVRRKRPSHYASSGAILG